LPIPCFNKGLFNVGKGQPWPGGGVRVVGGLLSMTTPGVAKQPQQ